MRHYYISNNSEEMIEVLNNKNDVYEIKSADYSKVFHVKKIAGKVFISTDLIRWKRIPKHIVSKDNFTVSSETFHLYRGFKPSGLGISSPGELITEMPGKVVKVFAKPGDVVREGDTLLILEAMKMENEIKASISGVVSKVHVTDGQVIDSNTLLIELNEE